MSASRHPAQRSGVRCPTLSRRNRWSRERRKTAHPAMSGTATAPVRARTCRPMRVQRRQARQQAVSRGVERAVRDLPELRNERLLRYGADVAESRNPPCRQSRCPRLTRGHRRRRRHHASAKPIRLHVLRRRHCAREGKPVSRPGDTVWGEAGCRRLHDPVGPRVPWR